MCQRALAISSVMLAANAATSDASLASYYKINRCDRGRKQRACCSGHGLCCRQPRNQAASDVFRGSCTDGWPRKNSKAFSSQQP